MGVVRSLADSSKRASFRTSGSGSSRHDSRNDRAGELREFEADGVRILLVRRGDEFFAFPPLCPHHQEELEILGICRQ